MQDDDGNPDLATFVRSPSASDGAMRFCETLAADSCTLRAGAKLARADGAILGSRRCQCTDRPCRVYIDTCRYAELHAADVLLDVQQMRFQGMSENILTRSAQLAKEHLHAH